MYTSGTKRVYLLLTLHFFVQIVGNKMWEYHISFILLGCFPLVCVQEHGGGQVLLDRCICTSNTELLLDQCNPLLEFRAGKVDWEETIVVNTHG
jgi:hypothetical protein